MTESPKVKSLNTIRRWYCWLALVAALTLAGFLSWSATVSSAFQATPTAATPVPVTIASEVLVSATPATVQNAQLALARVTIMPGAAIPTHYHPGTQIAVVVQGTLTYTVFTGDVVWQSAATGTNEPRIISLGETVQIETGDTLIETPGSIHQGRNDGAGPVVIYLSTLFPEGEPRAILAEPPAS